ncbi:MAG: T9SS type A sorting domain-containing protein [Bacteroidota bacterium]
MKYFPNLFFRHILLVFICLVTYPLSAQQLLNWQYTNIIDDQEQTASNPSLTQDANGRLHVTYWDNANNQLIYGQRLNGNWQFEEVDPGNPGGYASACKIDASGQVHVAFIREVVGNAQLFYGVRSTNGTWAIEPVEEDSTIGTYGFDLGIISFIVHSVDIELLDNGEPVITFFDGDITEFVSCGGQIAGSYFKYEMNMKVAHRESGFWKLSTLSVPMTTDPRCTLTNKDRFGEFCKIIKSPGDSLLVLTNSVHNHELLLFSSQPGQPLSWKYQQLDSLDRLFNSLDYRESYHYPDFTLQGDSVLHLVYGNSVRYGRTTTNSLRRNFFYARLPLDSLQKDSFLIQPFRFLPAQTDQNYRTYFSIEAYDNDSIYITYYDAAARSVLLTTSKNGGLNWQTDSVYTNLDVDASLQTALVGDSLFLLVADSENDQLLSASLKLGESDWTYQELTSSTKRGQYLGSQVVRVGGDDVIHLAFSESFEDQLFYGKRENGVWTYEPIDQAGQGLRNIELQTNASSEPVIAYILSRPNILRVARPDGSGGWTLQNVDVNSIPDDVDMVMEGDTIHICYFDLQDGGVKYAFQAAGGQSYGRTLVDSAGSSIGQSPSIDISPDGTLHLAYVNRALGTVKYAEKAPLENNWTITTLTDSFTSQPRNLELVAAENGNIWISYRDDVSGEIRILWRRNLEAWRTETPTIAAGNLVGSPNRLILDQNDSPWLLYNLSGAQEGVRLLRRDFRNGIWNAVSLVNNDGQIAQSFQFHLVERDFYVIGKKNAPRDPGLALLFSEEGSSTSIDPLSIEGSTIRIWPNPAQDQVWVEVEGTNKGLPLSVSLLDLQGRSLLTKEFATGDPNPLEVNGLPSGLYLIRIQSPTTQRYAKLLIR